MRIVNTSQDLTKTNSKFSLFNGSLSLLFSRSSSSFFAQTLGFHWRSRRSADSIYFPSFFYFGFLIVDFTAEMKKHFTLPRNAILRDGGEPHSPNPSISKSKPPRKLRSAKENAPPLDRNTSTPDHRSMRMKNPLPPRPPPSNPLKRKLSAETATESGFSDSGVKVISPFSQKLGIIETKFLIK